MQALHFPDWPSNEWLRLGVLVVGALLLALVLRWIMHLLAHGLAKAHPLVADIHDRASRPFDWLVPLLLSMLALRWAPTTHPRLLDLLHHVLLIAFLTLFTWLVVRCISVFELAAIRRFPMDTQDNLRARRVVTQVRVLARTGDVMVIILGTAVVLLTIPGARELGASLLASAGVAGLAIGFAAKPVLGNLIAGLQIAITQPIRLDDVVIIEGEWGRIEEITGSYVSVRIWDQRRLVVPLSWFIENPFQNWTRTTSQIMGTVFLLLDYRVPLQPLREELKRLANESPDFDGRVCILQVTDATDRAVQLRCLVSSIDSGHNFDLRCHVREGLITYVQSHYPDALPRLRAEVERSPQPAAADEGEESAPATQHSPSAEDGRRGAR
jgi:hypothetical protein